MSIYLVAVWNILQRFGVFYDCLGHFVFIGNNIFRYWYHVPLKIWQPCCGQRSLWKSRPMCSPKHSLSILIHGKM
jgi:hypothetical protein